jgi:hypothetical protein
LFAAARASRVELGLPEDWNRVELWLHCKKIESLNITSKSKRKARKAVNEEISVDWSTFGKREIPSEPETRIDIGKLEELVDRLESRLLENEVLRARRVIKYLKTGAPAHQKRSLNSCLVENKVPGEEGYIAVLKTVKDWLVKGFIAGPFKEPPLDGLRVNGMIAIIKGDKTRAVLNMSAPEGNSFNDNVDTFEVERVHMDTARTFSYAVLRAGRGARLDKTDVKDAFKNVPARIEDLRLQGFMVLDKYFVELRMIFGTKTALVNYDVLGNTIEKLAIAESGIPRCFVLRAVDDQPVATPVSSDFGHKFVQSYKSICKSINMEIADDCENCESFHKQTEGKGAGSLVRLK